MNLGDSEKILKSIAEWALFEEAVILSKDMRFPSMVLKDQLNISSWKNIPIPVKEALEVIKTSLLNTERLVLFLCRESRYKSENTSLAIKNVLGQHKERDRMMLVKINNNHKEAQSSHRKSQQLIETVQQKIRERFDQMEREMEQERIYINQRFQMYMNKDVMVNWVNN